MDVRVILGVDVLQLRMERLVAGSGQTGVAVIDPDIRITLSKVGHVVVAGEPGRHGVGDLVGLGLEALPLNESAQRF